MPLVTLTTLSGHHDHTYLVLESFLAVRSNKDLSIVPPATPKNKKVFGLGGGVEAQGPEKMNSIEPRGLLDSL